MTAKPPPNPGPDVNIGWKLEVGTTVTFLAATIAVGLRCFARWKYSQRGWDDYLMIFALIQALVATVIDFIAVDHGLGRHLFYLTYKQAVNQQYYSLLAQVFCVHALTFAKISIIISYLRVIRGPGNRAHKISLWTLGILVFVINTMVIITFYTGCNPTKKSWDPKTKGTCWTIRKKLVFFILQGAFSAFSDFFLALSPFLFLHELKLNRRKKILVLSLMGMAAVTGIFAIIRTVETGTQLHLPPDTMPDVSYSTILGLTWAGMERNIAILIGSIPALNPLVAPTARFLSQTLGSSRSRLRSARSQSYQLSDASQPNKLTGDDSRREYSATGSAHKTGAPVSNVSEEYILPSVQNREIA